LNTVILSSPDLLIPFQDFQGQKLSEYLYYYLIILCGAAGWIYGYMQQSFLPTFYAWAVGLALSLIVCTPDWPFYNRHPVAWLKEFPRPSSGGGNKKD
jgi:signal peptidase complex subunit 1